MSKNKETGKHSQSVYPKVSFNLKDEYAEMLDDVQQRLVDLTGSKNWNRTEVIEFSIQYAKLGLITREELIKQEDLDH